MTGRRPTTEDRKKLRSKADARATRDAPGVSPKVPASVLQHELDVHRIELEMQNEELARAQVALEVSRDRYVDLYASAPVGYLTLSEDGRIQDSNLTGSALLGVERGRLRGRGFAGFVAPESLARWGALRSEVQKDAERHSCDLALRRDDGAILHAHLVCQLQASGDAESALRVVLTDVTEQRRAEAKVRTYVDLAPAALFVANGRGRFVDCNPAALELLGISAATLRSMSITDLLEGPDRVQALRDFGSLVQNGKLESEYQLVRPDGWRAWVAVRAVKIADDRYMAFCLDVTERHLAEQKLQESESRFRVLANQTPVGIYRAGPRGEVEYLNPAGLRMFGLTEAETYNVVLQEAIHPDDREWLSRAWEESVSSGMAFGGVYRLLDRAGKETWVRAAGTAVRDEAGAVVGYVGALMDITESRALQAQVAVSSRLAAMGTLVAGVAHEINNPLAGGMACQALAVQESQKIAELLRGGDPLDRQALVRSVDTVIELLDRAQGDGMSISRIVKDLAAFGRPDAQRAPVRISAAVEAAMRWLGVSVGDVATIRLVLEQTPDVLASAGQLEQVIVNLVTNAAHAIPQGRRGEITIRTGPGAEGMVRLEVADDGAGMTPEILEHVFDPFFTTRAEGKGTGLGLAICHAIATAHGGTLTATSVIGKGSTFRMELPAALTSPD